MNFLRKMINRDYDLKLNMSYEEFGKHPVYTKMDARKKPKDVFVIKFKDCTKVYAVSNKHRQCSECPMHTKDIATNQVHCGLKYNIGHDITVCACTRVGLMKGEQIGGFIDMDSIMEDL